MPLCGTQFGEPHVIVPMSATQKLCNSCPHASHALLGRQGKQRTVKRAWLFMNSATKLSRAETLGSTRARAEYDGIQSMSLSACSKNALRSACNPSSFASPSLCGLAHGNVRTDGHDRCTNVSATRAMACDDATACKIGTIGTRCVGAPLSPTHGIGQQVCSR